MSDLSEEVLRYQSVMPGVETVRMTQFTGKPLEKSSFSWESALLGAESTGAVPTHLNLCSLFKYLFLRGRSELNRYVKVFVPRLFRL